MISFAWLRNIFNAPKLAQPRRFTAEGFAFVVEIDGMDLVVRNTRATCFGGSNDPEDSGETASGICTKGQPDLQACALPMNYTGSNGPTRAALAGSPLPKLPWRTPVEVTCGGKTIVVPFIDLGPHKRTGNGIDLTIAAARQFDPRATATRFAAMVTYRIRGGAGFLRSQGA